MTMVYPHPVQLFRRSRLSLLASFIALCLLFVTTTAVLADTVRISDPVGVLNQSQVQSEGAKLPYPLDIYTTATFQGSALTFITRTISVHLTSTRLIVIAVDTVHHYLAIVNGSSVPLSKTQDASAGSAFKNGFSGNNFTGATLAAIRSLESALGVGTSSSPGSGLVLGIIIIGVVLLVIISIVVGFVRRLLGIQSPPKPAYQQPQHQDVGEYGDGRDNFGSGAVGDF